MSSIQCPSVVDVNNLWVQHQQRNNKTRPYEYCIYCPSQNSSLATKHFSTYTEVGHENSLAHKDENTSRTGHSKYEKDTAQEWRPNGSRRFSVSRSTKTSTTDRPPPGRPRGCSTPTEASNQAPLSNFSRSYSSLSKRQLEQNKRNKKEDQMESQDYPSRRPPSNSCEEDKEDIISQPDTRAISQEQLVAEVKGIYAGLVKVEAKCIEVDNKQASFDLPNSAGLKLKQWQALIALHRTLFHEHHDFFLAVQHPSANPALSRLSSKYAMAARMWRHGIHSFLELLHHHPPAFLDHMLAFIYSAYSMMDLLYETVPAFKDTWIECLGDLGRYCMATEDEDTGDGEVWTNVSRYWCTKALDRYPSTLTLYHHLTFLARRNGLQQLLYYVESLCVVIPLISARDSILTFSKPVLSPQIDSFHSRIRLPRLVKAFTSSHSIQFTKHEPEKSEAVAQELVRPLHDRIERVIYAFFQQGRKLLKLHKFTGLRFTPMNSPLSKSTVGWRKDHSGNSKSPPHHHHVSEGKKTISQIVPQRMVNPNVHPLFHVTLVFILQLSIIEKNILNSTGEKSRQLLESILKLSPRFLGGLSDAGFCHQEGSHKSSKQILPPVHISGLKNIMAWMIVGACLPTALAAPVGNLPNPEETNGISSYFKITWAWFRDELAGAMLSNLSLGLVLILLYVILSSRKMSSALPYVLAAVAFGTFCVGLDMRLSSYQLALLAIFSAALNHRYLSRKLADFPRSSGVVYLTVVTCGLLFPMFTHYLSPMTEGRYSKWLIAGIVTGLPTTLLFI